jgi:hypothetical protein
MSDYGMWIFGSGDFDEGAWLASYDLNAHDGFGEARATNDPAGALRFPDVAAVFAAWKEPSTVRPLRDDGKPNRPLSAFTITAKALP